MVQSLEVQSSFPIESRVSDSQTPHDKIEGATLWDFTNGYWVFPKEKGIGIDDVYKLKAN